MIDHITTLTITVVLCAIIQSVLLQYFTVVQVGTWYCITGVVLSVCCLIHATWQDVDYKLNNRVTYREHGPNLSNPWMWVIILLWAIPMLNIVLLWVWINDSIIRLNLHLKGNK